MRVARWCGLDMSRDYRQPEPLPKKKQAEPYVPPGPASNADLCDAFVSPAPPEPAGFDPGDAAIIAGIDESVGTERSIEYWQRVQDLETYE
jgi:hypothetical protein